MKYIDSEKLIAEIRKLRSGSCIGESDDYYEYAKSEIIDIITTHQQEQPEAELEREIDVFFDKWDKNSCGCIFDENGACVTVKTIKGVVKHFLNARKEDKK